MSFLIGQAIRPTVYGYFGFHSKANYAVSARESHLLERFFLESRLSRIDSVLEQRSTSLTVVLDGVQNHHNVSAVLRSADAFGLQNVILVGESFTYSRGVSLGTERWLSLERVDTPEQCIQQLRTSGSKIVLLQSAELSTKEGAVSVSIAELPFGEKLAFVFGNEHKGVSPEFRKAADLLAHIPMVGFVESLNISVAAAITFYTALLMKRPVLPAEERRELRERWLVKDLRGGEEILERLRLTPETLTPKTAEPEDEFE